MSDDVVGMLLGELEDLLGPLVRVTEAPDPLVGVRRFLRGCGWTVTDDVDPQPIVSGITSLVDAVEAARDGLDPGDLAAFVQALEGLADLVAAVEDLVDLIASGGPAAPTDDELAAFGEDVLHTLAVGWITRKRVLGDIAGVLRLVEPVDLPAASVGGWLERRAHRAVRLRPAVVTDLLADPLGYLRGIVVPNDWAASVDAAATHLFLATHLSPLLARAGGAWRTHPDALADAASVQQLARRGVIEVVAAVADDAGRARFGTELELFSAADTNEAGQTGPAVELAPFGGYQHTFVTGGWSVTLGAAIALGGVDAGDSAPAIRISGDGVEVTPSLDARLDVGALLELDALLGGQGTRIELGTLDLSAFLGVQGGAADVGFSLVATGSRIVLSAADLGAAVAAVAAFESTIEVDLGLQWSLLGGLRLAGSAALELEISGGIDIGGVVTLSGLRVRLAVGEQISLGAVTDVAVKLGPVALSFDDLGLNLVLSFPPEGGNLGGADLSLALEPPKGLGVRVDAGVVSGGGFLYLDPDRGEYAGVLELSFPALSLSLKAVGIFTTRLPGGAEGYALLLLVYTEFPSVQLGYGFTLDGVGGILGIQHGISIEALQAGMRTGALDNVLFPHDPVADAPALLADLRAIFPLSPGSLTFGPALQIGWGAGIVTITLGLVLQLDGVMGSGAGEPSIARIVLLGQLKVELPPVEGAPELVRLVVDVLGYYDVAEQELGIDARLRDSHIVSLPLTGSLVVRARFGDDPVFIMAIGGFHPRFTDLPPGIPPQDRLGVTLRYEIVTVRIACYTAITSNSFQFGAEASLLVEAAAFRVEAYLGFDALFLFQPRFHFDIEFRVGASISWQGWDLAAVRVQGRLTGPGRWEITGSASLKVLFWEIAIDVDVGWGDVPLDALPEVAVLPQVLAALTDPQGWHASLPAGRPYVTLRQVTAGPVLVHPLGSLEVTQKVVPLGVAVDRVGKSRPSDGNRFDLTAVRLGSRAVPRALTSEHFARAEYWQISEGEKLTAPSFERFDAGARFGTAGFVVPAGADVSFDPEYETGYLEQPDVAEISLVPGAFLVQQAVWGAAATSALRRAAKTVGGQGLGVAVAPSRHAVADAATLADRTTAVAGVGALTWTAAHQAAGTTGRFVVVEAVELVSRP